MIYLIKLNPVYISHIYFGTFKNLKYVISMSEFIQQFI